MIKLSETWLTDGLLDNEYKQYELLAYLQKVQKHFSDLKVYPYLTDLLRHYEDLILFKGKKEELRKQFPKKIKEINLKNATIKYEDLIKDSKYMESIDELIEFALPEFRKVITYGKFIKDEVERCVDVIEIGISITNKDNGYLIIDDHTIDVYQYQYIFGVLKTKLIRVYPKEYSLSYENIRLDLVGGAIIAPPTFLIDTPIKYPIDETLFPIAKRLLIKRLTTNA